MIETLQFEVKSAEEVDNYLFLLKDLLLKTLLDAEELPALKKRFGELYKNGYPENLQLPRAYISLLSHLLHLEPVSVEPTQFPNGVALLDTLGWCPSREISEPIEHAQLGSLWMILGARLKNEVLLRAGLKIAMWHVQMLDAGGMPHLSTWSRASSFKLSELSQWHHTIFTLAYRVTGDRAFYHLSEIAREVHYNPEAFPTKLLLLTSSTGAPIITAPFHPFAEEMTVGIIKFRSNEISIAAQLSGWNSGLFSYHKKDTAVLNAGPQVGAFDDLSQFGITRVCYGRGPVRPFQEMTWEKTAYNCQLKGWTSLAKHPFWLHMDFMVQGGRAKVMVDFQEKTLQSPLSFVLFLKCDKLIVGGKHYLETGTLERYEGKLLPIELQGLDERLVLEPDLANSMRVIPLAGGDYFWGAQFLVAFTVDKSFGLNIK